MVLTICSTGSIISYMQEYCHSFFYGIESSPVLNFDSTGQSKSGLFTIDGSSLLRDLYESGLSKTEPLVIL